jgi:hypothetical protein
MDIRRKGASGEAPFLSGVALVVGPLRLEPSGQNALGADEDLAHRRSKVVVRNPLRHGTEVLGGPHVTVEKAWLVLALVEAGEVAARSHQPSLGRAVAAWPLPFASVRVDELSGAAALTRRLTRGGGAQVGHTLAWMSSADS